MYNQAMKEVKFEVIIKETSVVAEFIEVNVFANINNKEHALRKICKQQQGMGYINQLIKEIDVRTNDILGCK